MTNNLLLKIEAHRSWADILERCDKARSLFQRAGETVPEELKALVGNTPASPMHSPHPIFRPPSPPNAGDDWIWIGIEDAATTTIMLAILGLSEQPLTVKDIRDKIVALEGNNSEIVMGSVYNAAQRMITNQILIRDEEGRLTSKQPDKIAVIYEGRLWGPVSIFQMAEQAAHRRNAEVFLLRKSQAGLLQSQMVAMLRNPDVLNPAVPMNKDLIKGDFEVMNGKRVRRIGNSKKWEAI